MGRSTPLVIVVLATGVLVGDVHGSEDLAPLSRLSGSWVGRRSVEPDGKCEVSRTRYTVAFDIHVVDEGAVELKYMGHTKAKGRVTPSGKVTFGDEYARAICEGKERTYTLHYEGRFTSEGKGLHLKLEAIDMPCPPCRFKERLLLRRIELEP